MFVPDVHWLGGCSRRAVAIGQTPFCQSPPPSGRERNSRSAPTRGSTIALMSNVSRDILHLGCGRKRMEGAVNVDRAEQVGPDVVLDLNCRPWPFRDGQFGEVWAYDVVE